MLSPVYPSFSHPYFIINISISNPTRLRVMITGDFLTIEPSELNFPFEFMKQSSCSVKLTNNTDQYIAFKVKTNKPRNCSVLPNTGAILPFSTCYLTVAMQAQIEAPLDTRCKEKFLIQSVVAPKGTAYKDINPEMFDRKNGKVVEEFKLRAFYIFSAPSSPGSEEFEERSFPEASFVEGMNRNAPLHEDPWPMISKLTEEKASAIQQNQKLHQEMEVMRKDISKIYVGGFSILCVMVVGLLGVLVGYFIKNT